MSSARITPVIICNVCRCRESTRAERQSEVSSKCGSTADTYLRDGHFHIDRMLAVFAQLANGNGQHAVPRSRIVCRVDWPTGSRSLIDAVIEFESRVNDLWRHHDDVVICTFRLEQFQDDAVIDMLRTHPAVIIGEILEQNPLFLRPQQFLRHLGQ